MPTSTPTSTAEDGRCKWCGGARYFVLDVAPGDPRFGKVQICQHCTTDAGRNCGLSSDERTLTVGSIAGSGATYAMLRWLANDCANNPAGMVTLWGAWGTAKTMTAQVIVAELVRRRKAAKFIHAKAAEQGWFDDMHADRHDMRSLTTVQTLAIDELDKVNLKSDWVRQQFQLLMDERYRRGVTGDMLTIVTLNGRPDDVLPGDVASRLGDARFYRQWTTAEPNAYVVERWGAQALPGIIELKAKDGRQYMRPAWAEQER
jgi:hypothetical protein